MIQYIRYCFIALALFSFTNVYSQWNNVNSIGGNSTITFNASKVLSNSNIFLIGDDGVDLFNRKGVIYKSIDNGLSFTKTNTLPNAFQLLSVNFIDNNNGFIFGQTQRYKGFIGRTTNGGQTWTDDSINGTELLKANSFINSQIGYTADFTRGNLNIYKTTDNGNTWNQICNNYYQNGPVNDIQFLTENLGFLCTQTNINSASYAKVMRTVDGGKNWTTLRFSYDEDYTAIHFFDYNNGYVLTYYGKIYKTANAGVTWTLVRNSATLQNRDELKFINPYVGYAVGADSILKTTDGGNTWTNIHGISTFGLYGYTTVDVNANGVGITAGGIGSFYSYTNNFGGASANNALTSAYISGYDSVCAGQNGTIRFDFTGTPPWSVSYSNGTTTQSISNVTATPYFTTTAATGSRQVFSVTSFSANGVSSSNVFGKAILAVLNAQPVSATISGTTSICISDSALLTIRLKGNSPFTFTYSDGTINSTVNNFYDSIYKTYVHPLQTKIYTIVSVADKCGIAGTGIGNANITVNTPPAAPSDFVADTFMNNKIKLNWTDNATNEDSIIVERRFDSVPNFSRLASLAPNSVSFIDTTSMVNYKYYYRLKYSINNSNCNTYSGLVSYQIAPLFKVVNTINSVQNNTSYPTYNSWYDWDNDGDLDNINSKLILNMGNDNFQPVNDTALEKRLAGNVRIYDFNNDNKPDIFKYDSIRYDSASHRIVYKLNLYLGIGNNKFNKIDSVFNESEPLTIVDINGDGINEISPSPFASRYPYKVYIRFIDTLLSVFLHDLSWDTELREYRKGKKDCNNPNSIFPVSQSTSEGFGSFTTFNIYDLDNDAIPDLLFNSNTSASIALMSSTDIRVYPKRQIYYGIYDKYISQSTGSAYEDFDNDGYIDILTASRVYIQQSNNYTNKVSLLLNNKSGDFSFFDLGLNNIIESNLAIADFNKDGRVDFSSQQSIYKNNLVNSNRWININCIGTTSAKVPYSARIKIKATINGVSMWQTRDIITHSIMGGNNSTAVHFGLGNATQIDSIKVFWPSGIIWDSTNISPNQNFTITEPHIIFPKVLEKPANFTGSTYNAYSSAISEVYLKWCTTLNAQSYTVQRKRLGDPNFSTIVVLPLDSITYTDTSLLPYTKYVYRIVANGYGQTTYSDTLLMLTNRVRIYFNNSTYNNITYSANNKIDYSASRSRTLLFDIFSKTDAGIYNKIATIHAFSTDTFVNYPYYMITNLPRNSTVCYYFAAYYALDSLRKSYSDTQCLVVKDYCLPQYRKYGILGGTSPTAYTSYGYLSYTPEPTLCQPIQIFSYNDNNISNYNYSYKWYWNDSVLTTERYNNSLYSDGYSLTNASRRGYYRAIFNASSVCPDTSAKLYVNFDGNGLNTVSFEVLNRNLHPTNVMPDLNYICNPDDTIYLKVHSKYPIYDSTNYRNAYLNNIFLRDSGVYKLFLKDLEGAPNYYFNTFMLYDKNLPYCSIETPLKQLPLFHKKLDIGFIGDSVIATDSDDLILSESIYNPVWQYRKHTNLPWVNIPTQYYYIYNYSSNNYGSSPLVGYNKSGYYRVVDTFCNQISREALGLWNDGYRELIEAQLFDSTNILMKNVPYTFTMYTDNNYTTTLKIITGTTDNYGRLILDSLPIKYNYTGGYPPSHYYTLYPWKISFVKNNIIKTISDTALLHPFYVNSGIPDDEYAVYRLRFIFQINNLSVGIKQHNTILEDLAIYPNPSIGSINIKFNNKISSQLSISILNPLGQIMKKIENNRLIQNGEFNSYYSLDLPKGLYLIQINAGDEQVTQKLVIN